MAFEENQKSTDSLVTLLEELSRNTTARIDRAAIQRAVYEAHAEGNERKPFEIRVVEGAQLLNLRVHVEECSIDDIKNLVADNIPIAAVLEDSPTRSEWLLLVRSKGRKCFVCDQSGNKGNWISWRELSSRLGLSSKRDKRTCLLARQTLIEAEVFSSPGHLSSPPGKPLKPFRRLLRLIGSEKSDLTTIFIFSFVIALLSLTTPLAIEALVNTVAWGRYIQPIFILSFVLFCFLAFSAVLNAIVTCVVEVLQRRIFVRIVEDLAFRIPRVSQAAFDDEHPPELVNRFFDVVTLQKALPKLLLEGLSVVIQTAAGMVVLAFYHPWLLGYDILLATLMFCTVFVLGRGAVSTAMVESRTKYSVAAWLEEIARHQTAFKLNGGNSFALDKADHLVIDYLHARRKHFVIFLRQIFASWILYAFAATLLLGLGGWLVVMGELTLGQLVAAELIVMLVVGAFTKIGRQLETYYDLLAGIDKLGALLDLPLEPHNHLKSVPSRPAAKLMLSQASVVIDRRQVLAGFSAQFDAGSTSAIIGPPASGKSVIADLICGLRVPASGYLELNGVDSRELRLDSLRNHVGISRGPDVFEGTIEENVHLGRLNVTSDDVRRALRAVGLLDAVVNLNHGVLTALQTGGHPLTETQVERLMLARAIASSPQILLIDSSLDRFDKLIAAEILNSIRQEYAATILVLTNRRAIAELCPRIVELGNAGSLAKSG